MAPGYIIWLGNVTCPYIIIQLSIVPHILNALKFNSISHSFAVHWKPRPWPPKNITIILSMQLIQNEEKEEREKVTQHIYDKIRYTFDTGSVWKYLCIVILLKHPASFNNTQQLLILCKIFFAGSYEPTLVLL